MIEKKVQIMEVAIQCFAAKGFHATSIQEIADALGMAKGSLYFYFKSKEDLLVSIFEHYFDRLEQEMTSGLENPDVSPAERLVDHISTSYRQLSENRDFILIFIRERSEMTSDTHRMITRLKARRLWGIRLCITGMYGKPVEPHAFDAATMFQSIVDGYLGYVLLDGMSFDMDRLCAYLLARLDDLVQGLIGKRDKPVLDDSRMEAYMSDNGWQDSVTPEHHARLAVESIRETIGELEFGPAEREELEDALRVLDEQLALDQPTTVVMKGMVALLKGLKLAPIRRQIAELETYMKML